MTPLCQAWLDFTRDLLEQNCASAKLACEYFEITDVDGFRKIVEASIDSVKDQVRADPKAAAQAVGDAVAVGILFGAHAAKKGLL